MFFFKTIIDHFQVSDVIIGHRRGEMTHFDPGCSKSLYPFICVDTRETGGQPRESTHHCGPPFLALQSRLDVASVASILAVVGTPQGDHQVDTPVWQYLAFISIVFW